MRSPSCLERPYSVSTGSWDSSVRTAPLASPVTTVEAKTRRRTPAASQAEIRTRVPSTLTARIFAASRCEAISAARWKTHSGATSETAAVRRSASVRSPATAVHSDGSEPGRRTSAWTSWPRPRSSAQTTLPRKPLAPVTRTFTGRVYAAHVGNSGYNAHYGIRRPARPRPLGVAGVAADPEGAARPNACELSHADPGRGRARPRPGRGQGLRRRPAPRSDSGGRARLVLGGRRRGGDPARRVVGRPGTVDSHAAAARGRTRARRSGSKRRRAGGGSVDRGLRP